MITLQEYQNLGGTILSDVTFPNYYKPIVTKNEYSKGYINRYFVQKINDLIITEVDKNIYNKIYVTVYNKLSIRWIISGPKNNVYKNKMLDRTGVTEQNIKTLNVSENKMKGLKTYLNNPLEFWGGK